MEQREKRNYAPFIVALTLSLMSGAIWALITWALGAQVWEVYGIVGAALTFVALSVAMVSVT
jgi:hypothetical protein